MPTTPLDKSISRRNFTIGAAMAAATAVVIPQQVLAQTEAGKKTPDIAEQAQTSMAKLAPGAQAEVRAKFTELLRKYGERLNDEQKADIQRILADTQAGLEHMRAFSLENGDQPATVLHLSQVADAPVRSSGPVRRRK